jgi:hypothetical protein
MQFPNLKIDNMEDKVSPFDSLLEKAEDYGKTSFELLKLKTLDKTSDVASSFVSSLVVTFTILFFLLFVSMGTAFWLGDILGKSSYGFFIVGAFYGIAGFVLYFFMNNWIKRIVSNSIIQHLFN